MRSLAKVCAALVVALAASGCNDVWGLDDVVLAADGGSSSSSSSSSSGGECVCPHGYKDVKGDGTRCQDIDECASGSDDCEDLRELVHGGVPSFFPRVRCVPRCLVVA